MLSLDNLVFMETRIALYLMTLLVTDATCTTLFEKCALIRKDGCHHESSTSPFTLH